MVVIDCMPHDTTKASSTHDDIILAAPATSRTKKSTTATICFTLIQLLRPSAPPWLFSVPQTSTSTNTNTTNPRAFLSYLHGHLTPPQKKDQKKRQQNKTCVQHPDQIRAISCKQTTAHFSSAQLKLLHHLPQP